jgi:phosphoribosylaminoimidazolecarboxamide formyltransferase/IMP cyclohydrolase
MVVSNLYPFVQAVADPKCTLEEALENIDIGGPSMLRSAAKNFPWVIPLCNPEDYPQVIKDLKEQGDISHEFRQKLAIKAFAHTCTYDSAITNWLGKTEELLPEVLSSSLERGQILRYGENPHQQAALYKETAQPRTLAWAEPLQGKELSYNNYNDADAALALVSEFEEPAAVAVKHAVPCGVGLGDSSAQAFARAREADPVSIFGGIVAFNHAVDGETAKQLREIFLEVVIAPEFTGEAREVLASKKNLRLLACPPHSQQGLSVKTISGGMLVQEADRRVGPKWRVAGAVQPQGDWEKSGQLAWFAAKHAKSNSIVIAKGSMTQGVGSGCTSRIAAARAALEGAGDAAIGAVMASDGFIPFTDVVEAAAKAGINTIIQPGGSKGDDEVIAAADKHDIAMIFTGIRHFKH